MHGPNAGSTAEGVHDLRWKDGVVPIVDAMLSTIGKRKVRRAWKKCLAGAIELWKPTGLTFTVERRDPLPYAGTMPDPIKGFLLVTRNTSGDERTFEIGGSDWAVVALNYYEPFILDGMPHNLAHEIGHALGLGHRYEAGSYGKLSVMGKSGFGPDDHDIESVKNYYA
jgi:hypothetical protein